MRTIPLSGSDTRVSSLALGTWTFAGDAIWGESEEAACRRVVHAAVERGIALFDTAPNYGDGRSEAILGRALHGLGAGRTADVTVATKCKVDGATRESLREIVFAGIKRLKRDRIDLMQIHWPGSATDTTLRALDTFLELKEEGAIGEIGVCNFGVFDLQETAEYPIVTNQIPYNLLWRGIEDTEGPGGSPGIATTSRTVGRKTIAYSVLQQGLLTGRYTDLAEFPRGRQRTLHFPGHRSVPDGSKNHNDLDLFQETRLAVARLLEISAELDRSLLDLAVAYVSGSPFIDVTLIGARTETQLERTVTAAETALEPDVRATLDEATAALRRALGGHIDMFQYPSRVRYPGPDGAPVRTR